MTTPFTITIQAEKIAESTGPKHTVMIYKVDVMGYVANIRYGNQIDNQIHTITADNLDRIMIGIDQFNPMIDAPLFPEGAKFAYKKAHADHEILAAWHETMKDLDRQLEEHECHPNDPTPSRIPTTRPRPSA